MMYETYSQIAQKKYVCMSACVCACVCVCVCSSNQNTFCFLLLSDTIILDCGIKPFPVP